MKKKKSKSLSIAVAGVILAIMLIGAIFGIVVVLEKTQVYLAFTVKDEYGTTLTTSDGNNMYIGKENTFSVSYLYKEQKKSNNTSFKVELKGGAKEDFNITTDEGAVSWNETNFSEAFQLKMSEGGFSINVPTDMTTLVPGATDGQGNPLYLADIMTKEYFMLTVSSYNNQSVINYRFHLANRNNIIVDMDRIEIGAEINFDCEHPKDIDVDLIVIENGDVIFVGGVANVVFVESIIISDDKILFDGGVANVVFVESIIISDDKILFDGGTVGTVSVISIVISGGDILFTS